MDDLARMNRSGGVGARVAGVAAALLFGLSKRGHRPPPEEDAGNPDTRVETRDTPLWVIGLLAGLAAGLIVLVVVALMFVFPDATRDQPKGLVTAMPEPQLQTKPAADMRAYRAEAERRLNSYGWVDRQQGVARVPINEAMRRVAEQGIPDWPGAKP
ncbi:hypothetical protein [Azospirillum sp. sgz302134]